MARSLRSIYSDEPFPIPSRQSCARFFHQNRVRRSHAPPVPEVAFSMRRHSFLLLAASLRLASLPAHATVFATVHGVVHDPQHRPIAGADVTLQAADSAFTLHAKTDSDGEFDLPPGPHRRLSPHRRRAGLCHRHTAAHHRLGHQPRRCTSCWPSPPTSQTVVVEGSSHRSPRPTPSPPPRSSPAQTSTRPPAPAAPSAWR